MSAIDLKIPFIRNRPMNWLAPRFVAGLAAVIIADWLFLDWGARGLSLVLFLCLLALVALAVSPFRATGRNLCVAGAILAAGLAALIEDAGLLSILITVAGTLIFVLMIVEGRPLRLARMAPRAAQLPFLGLFWLVGDVNRVSRLGRKKRGPKRILASLVAWIVPACALLVFGSLFADANPLLSDWFALLDPRLLFDPEVMRHLLFWSIILCLIWPLLHLRLSRQSPTPKLAAPAALADAGPLFGESAILRSLVLLNALFALQTGLDITYLWAGVALPNGMTYAAYAHRGAYPLVLTALLAAGFVLAAMRRGGPAEKSLWIRPLVLVWVSQNVILMISSMLRLNLYVATYSLTYLRLAAFIWMGLVAAGLLLIVAQILRRESNGWLLEMNARSLALALFGACLFNAPAFVADYNVAHCREVRGFGAALDQTYLLSLGPQAIPAIDVFARGVPGHEGDGLSARSRMARPSDDWRGWSFRAWRLRRYLAMNSGVTRSAAAPLIQQ